MCGSITLASDLKAHFLEPSEMKVAAQKNEKTSGKSSHNSHIFKIRAISLLCIQSLLNALEWTDDVYDLRPWK